MHEHAGMAQHLCQGEPSPLYFISGVGLHGRPAGAEEKVSLFDISVAPVSFYQQASKSGGVTVELQAAPNERKK